MTLIHEHVGICDKLNMAETYLKLFIDLVKTIRGLFICWLDIVTDPESDRQLTNGYCEHVYWKGQESKVQGTLGHI